MERDWDDFWNAHRDVNTGVYGPPNPTLLEYARVFQSGKTSLRCLDVATGDGRYALPLMDMGYHVTAIDNSSVAIKRLMERRGERNSHLVVEQADALRFVGDSAEGYDLIICAGLLEELSIAVHEKLLVGLQKLTCPNGMNILRYVTEKRMTPESEPTIVTSHERNVGLYSEWKLIDTEMEQSLRRANIGRKIGDNIIHRYFKAANLIAANNK